MKYYLFVLKKYAVFNGRADRKEFWHFSIISFLISVLLGLLLNSSILVSYQITIIIPSIAVGVRRMHDVNETGWCILIPIYSIILACKDGTPGKNLYGEDPKGRKTAREEKIIEDPDALWKCPKCNSVNSNTSYSCYKCKYKII